MVAVAPTQTWGLRRCRLRGRRAVAGRRLVLRPAALLRDAAHLFFARVRSVRLLPCKCAILFLLRKCIASNVSMHFEMDIGHELDPPTRAALVLVLGVLVFLLLWSTCSRKPCCVIVADDFGISIERSRGIIKALKSGVVTATSVMANGDAAAEAIEMARVSGFLEVVGLHLNLTEGHPVSDPRDVPSLLLKESETQPGTGLKGGALLRGKMGYRAACASGVISPEEAAAEARAQLVWFQRQVAENPATALTSSSSATTKSFH